MNFFWQVMIKDIVQKVFTDILAPTQDLNKEIEMIVYLE
jgi:hypothetical protein